MQPLTKIEIDAILHTLESVAEEYGRGPDLERVLKKLRAMRETAPDKDNGGE